MKQFKFIFILHFVFAIYSVSGIASKFASQERVMSLPFILLYGIVLGILFFYAIVWQQLLKQIPLIVAYTNKAVTVIWGMIWGILFFNEKFTVQKGIGAFVIIAGVSLVVSSERKKGEE